MVKKHEHTEKRVQVHGTPTKKSSTIHTIFYTVIILAALAILAYTQFPLQQSPTDTILVTVNDEPIYLSQLDRHWQALPVQLKLQTTREDLLKQLVQEELLLQEVEKQQITVSQGEVEAFIQLQLAQTGRSFEEFTQLLELQGTSIEEVAQIYHRQLSIAKLFDQALGDQPIANNADIINYYDDHKQDFYRDEQVTVRHILLQEPTGGSDGNVQALVQDIEAQLDAANNQNFCELVDEYSMDIASRENCGEYTFQRGIMVPAFENASFNMRVGERRTIESEFGYHIIIKDFYIKETYAQLNDVLGEFPGQPTVREFIEQIVIQEKAKKLFNDYVGQLEGNATIVYT